MTVPPFRAPLWVEPATITEPSEFTATPATLPPWSEPRLRDADWVRPVPDVPLAVNWRTTALPFSMLET